MAAAQDAPGRLFESNVIHGTPFSMVVNLISPFGSNDTRYLLELRWVLPSATPAATPACPDWKPSLLPSRHLFC